MARSDWKRPDSFPLPKEGERREGLSVSRLPEADQAALRELAQPLLEEITQGVDPALLAALAEENKEE